MIIANVNDQESLESMCAKATVLINCVGPVSPVYRGRIMPDARHLDLTYIPLVLNLVPFQKGCGLLGEFFILYI